MACHHSEEQLVLRPELPSLRTVFLQPHGGTNTLGRDEETWVKLTKCSRKQLNTAVVATGDAVLITAIKTKRAVGWGPSVNGVELRQAGDTAILWVGGTLRFVHCESSTAFTLERIIQPSARSPSLLSSLSNQGGASNSAATATLPGSPTAGDGRKLKRVRVSSSSTQTRRARVLTWNTCEHDVWGDVTIRPGCVLAGRSQADVTAARVAVVVAASPNIVSLQEGHCGASGFDPTVAGAVAAELCRVHSFHKVGAAVTHQGCVELLVSNDWLDILSPISVEPIDSDGMLSSVVAHCWCGRSGQNDTVTSPPLTICATHLVPGGPSKPVPRDRLDSKVPRVSAWAAQCAEFVGTDLRVMQVQQLLSLIRSPGACVLAGDFNMRVVGRGEKRGVEPAGRILDEGGWVDSAAEAGVTYDQERNPFGAVRRSWVQCERYDRIYLRGNVACLRGNASVLHGHLANTEGAASEPACSCLHLSDHFAVLVDCDVELPVSSDVAAPSNATGS